MYQIQVDTTSDSQEGTSMQWQVLETLTLPTFRECAGNGNCFYKALGCIEGEH